MFLDPDSFLSQYSKLIKVIGCFSSTLSRAVSILIFKVSYTPPKIIPLTPVKALRIQISWKKVLDKSFHTDSHPDL